MERWVGTVRRELLDRITRRVPLGGLLQEGNPNGRMKLDLHLQQDSRCQDGVGEQDNGS
jgi:hypothetical protein